MFITTYKEIIKNLTRQNRREMSRIANSIIKKGGLDSKNLTEKERKLKVKLENWFERSFLESDYTISELLFDCANCLTNRDCEIKSQQFVINATRQSASEKAQLEYMASRGYLMSKIPGSGKNSIRFNQDSSMLIPNKLEGETSRSFDYKRDYNGITELFTGKVTFGQGGSQNGTKSEIVDFLRRSNVFLKNNPDLNMVFTALVDGDSFTSEDFLEFGKFTSNRVRLMSSDNYVPYMEVKISL
jgi:uncharacterized protein YdaT